MSAKPRGPIEVVVYVSNPVKIWQEDTNSVLVIYRAMLRRPRVWLARWMARSNSGNTGCCGYLIRNAVTGEIVEHVPPPEATVERL